MTRVEGELLLLSIIDDWKTLVKRFSLNSSDESTIYQCKFYADRIIKKFPSIEKQFFMDYYDEAVCDFIGVKYVMRRDEHAQEKNGFSPLIYDGEALYLFPLS